MGLLSLANSFGILKVYTLQESLIKHYKGLINANNTDIFVNNNENNKCYVSFIIATKIKPTYIRDLIINVKKTNDLTDKDTFILITNIRPNNSILKIINEDNCLNIQI